MSDERDERIGRILERLDRLDAVGFVRFRLDELVGDLGTLRRHLARLIEDFDDTYTAALVERIAWHVEALHAEQRPPAAIRYRELVDEGVPAVEAIDRALAEVDREAREVRHRLGRAS